MRDTRSRPAPELQCEGESLQLTGKLTSEINNVCWGFPGGAVVESLPANAGDTGSSPGLGGSRMPRSNWACEPQITEPACLEPVLCNERGRDSERPAQRDEEWSLLATTRESPRTETKTQHSNQSINK